MFGSERVFCQSNMRTGVNEWFFSAREGVFGPFSSKATANKALEEFVRLCIKNSDDGGRRSGQGRKLGLVPIDGYMNKNMGNSKKPERWLA